MQETDPTTRSFLLWRIDESSEQQRDDTECDREIDRTDSLDVDDRAITQRDERPTPGGGIRERPIENPLWKSGRTSAKFHRMVWRNLSS